MLGKFHLLSETKSKSGLNISGHYTKLGTGMFTKYGLTFITHPSVILVLHLRNCTHCTKSRLMSRSLQHWWASAMSSTRCEAGVSMQCTMWLTRLPRMLGWHHSNVELMRTWLVQHSFAPINIPFLTCLRNMAFLSSSSIFAMSVRARLRPGTYHVLVLMELRQICRMGAQGDGSLLNALSRKCYMCMLQYVHRGALP